MRGNVGSLKHGRGDLVVFLVFLVKSTGYNRNDRVFKSMYVSRSHTQSRT